MYPIDFRGWYTWSHKTITEFTVNVTRHDRLSKWRALSTLTHSFGLCYSKTPFHTHTRHFPFNRIALYRIAVLMQHKSHIWIWLLKPRLCFFFFCLSHIYRITIYIWIGFGRLNSCRDCILCLPWRGIIMGKTNTGLTRVLITRVPNALMYQYCIDICCIWTV